MIPLPTATRQLYALAALHYGTPPSQADELAGIALMLALVAASVVLAWLLLRVRGRVTP